VDSNSGTSNSVKKAIKLPDMIAIRNPRTRNCRLWPGLFVLGLALISIACNPGAPGDSADTAADFPISLYQGSETLGGPEINFSDLQGKPVVLNFWAGLCPPCRAEMPDLEAFHLDYRDRVTLIGVDVGEFMKLGSQDDARQLLTDLGITYPAGYTIHNGVIPDYGVLSMPTTVFIDADGGIYRKWSGVLDHDALASVTDKLLEETSAQ
jgi:thiol-disulfide isomerase/thioredoxin